MGHDRAARHLAPVRAALALCALTLAFLLPPTAAAEQPRFWTSCESKSGEGPVSAAGQCSIPRGIGVDPNIPGHLYVADQFNNRIVEITAWGEFVKAWGWGVRNGLAEPQACGPGAEPPSATCQKGLEGPGRGQLDLPQGVAVDSAGAVYVVDVPNGRLQKFDPAGEFAWMIGGEVNKTKIEEGKPEAEQNLCPIDPADVCQAGTAGTGQGQFGAWPFSSFVAIDTKSTATDEDDVLYVGDVDRIQEFDVGGAYQGEIALPEAGKVGSLAVDSRPEPTGGDLYFSYASSVNPTTGKAERPNVFRLSAAGAVEDTIEVPIPKALATDAEGYAYAYDEHAPGNKSAPGLHESRLLKFDPAGGLDEVVARKGQFEAGDFETTTGIATGSACLAEGADVYLSNSFHQDSFVRAWGPPPDDPECPPERRAPSIESQYAVSVGTVEAQIEAQVNPHYWSGSQGTTTYYTQYGTAACIEAEGWAGACVEEHPSPPGSTLGGGVVNEGVAAPVFLAGLEPGTAYRFRFAAESKDSEGVPTVEGQPVFGLEREFRTYQPPETPPPCPNDEFRTGPAADLPDCRAYELVSPVDKANGEIVVQTNNLGHLARLDQAAASGEGLAYSSYRAFGEPEGAPYSSQYIARRGADGWSSENVSPPQEGFEFTFPLGIDVPYRYFSPELEEGWHLSVTEPVPAGSGGVAGYDNVYRRESAGGSREACTTAPPPVTDPRTYLPRLQGVSAGGERAVFTANGALTEDASTAEAPGEFGVEPIPQLYACARAEAGGPRELHLVSVLPSGRASDEPSFAGSGVDLYGRSHSVRNALSADGSRVYWTTGSGSQQRIYLRENPTEPQSAQEFGSAQGAGDLIGPALGEGRTFAGNTTIINFQQLEGAFGVGQEVTGECLSAPGTEVFFPGTKVTAVELAAGKLKITPGAAANCTETEIVGHASDKVTDLTTSFPAFAAGQTIEGAGIAPGTTVEACSPSCGAAATSLTLSAPAVQTGQEVSLEAYSECTDPAQACTVPVAAGRFHAAAGDGSKAIYSAAGTLYEFDSATGSSEEIAPGFKGVAGVSEDLSRVYFASEEKLEGALPNKVPAQGGAEGEPVAGALNLYLREAGEGGGLAFVAALAEADAAGDGLAPLAAQPHRHSARATPDGRRLAFTSLGSPTGFDNLDRVEGRPAAEVYLFDAASGELRCASCNPSGARPVAGVVKAVDLAGEQGIRAAAYLPAAMSSLYAPRALSADGERLFFDSYDALALQDTNGRRDVYEWEAPGTGDCTAARDSFSADAGGCIELISSGKSSEDSELLDADASGADVFFATARSLLPYDPGLADIYDARVEGGLPLPPPLAPPCEGEACQSPPPAPEAPTPPTALAQPGGNASNPPVRCGARARRAADLARRAKALRRGARSARPNPRRARALRRRAAGDARKARQMGRAAKRCRSGERRRAR